MMESLKQWAERADFEADWRQFLADLEKERGRLEQEAAQEQRARETLRLIREAIARHERKKRRVRRLRRVTLAALVVSIALTVWALVPCIG